MALSSTPRGTGGNNSTGTTVTVTPGSNFAVWSMGVLVIALDNAGSGGSVPAAPATVVDSVGNTWTRRQNPIYDPNSASAGVELAFYTSLLTNRFTTANSLVITWDAGVSVAAKAWALWEVTAAADKMASYITGAAGTGAASGTPTVTTSSLTNGDMVIGGGGAESADTWAGDADTTNGSWATHQHAGFGTGTNGMSLTTQTKVVSATATQTYNPTLTSADQILGWISLREVTLPRGNFFAFFG
jgi:hypothetical protein